MSNYIPISVRKILMDTGWTENELAVYSTLLEKGAMKLYDLAEDVHIPVSTLQYVLKKLSIKQVITKSALNGKPLYSSGNVEQLRKWIKGYNKKFYDYETAVSNFIEQYDFNPQLYTPKIRVFEGLKGVKKSYLHSLNDIQCDEIINFFYITEPEEGELGKFFDNEFIPLRLKKGIKMKSLVIDTPFSNYYQKKNSQELRSIKLLKDKFYLNMNSEINIYDNFMHCVSFSEKGAFAMIIEDHNMVVLQKSLFNNIWDLV